MGAALEGVGWMCLGFEVLTSILLSSAFAMPQSADALQAWAVWLPLLGFAPFGGALVTAAFAQDKRQKAAEAKAGRRLWIPASLSWEELAARAPRWLQLVGLSGAAVGMVLSWSIGGVSLSAGQTLDIREVQGSLAWALVMYSAAAPLLISKGRRLRAPVELMPGEDDDL